MNEEILLREYHNLCHNIEKVYVVPLINYSFKKTSYLYLLYKDFIEQKNKYKIDIESLSVFAHPELVLSRFKKERSILHYHWLEISDFQSLSGMLWKLFWISLYKALNGKIIWTIHNEFPHSNNFAFLNKLITKYMAHMADKLQVHCKSAIDIMAPVLKIEENKFFIINHPDFPAEIIEKVQAVDSLNQKYFANKIKKDDIIFLMFGEVAEYKGIKEVIRIFNTLDEKKKLVIAGTVKKGNTKYFNELLSSIKNDEQILVYNRRIPDEDVPLFLNSCDYAIFNYRNVLTSGSVVLAINYNKRIIISSMGCLKELKGENVIHFKNIEELKNILSKD